MKKTMLALASAFSLAATCALADVKSEIVTAETHAGLAAKATALDGVHMHLHHAVNCLVGANGKGFDAKQLNPCAHNGNGAIPDTADAAKKARLQAAVDKAESGIAATDLATAQKAATDTEAMLKAEE